MSKILQKYKNIHYLQTLTGNKKRYKKLQLIILLFVQRGTLDCRDFGIKVIYLLRVRESRTLAPSCRRLGTND